MVQGFVAERFIDVANTFKALAAEQPQGGMAYALFVDGQPVVDLQSGEARPGQPWDDQTLNLIFSCTKGLVSIIVAQEGERGNLDPHAPVASYWPEFAAVSSTLTVRQLLEHRAGLSALRGDYTLDQVLNHDYVISELLKQGPLWEPGTGYSYHALTFGNLAAELLFRVTGKDIQTLFRERLSEPVGVEAYLGLPAAEEARVAEFSSLGSFDAPNALPGSPEDLQLRALTFGNAFPLDEPMLPGIGFNDPRVHQGVLAGAAAITTARALAKIWSSVVTPTDGVKLLQQPTIDFMRERTVSGPPVWGGEGYFHDRGFGVMVESKGALEWLSDDTFGHDGFGGQAGFASPKHNAGYGFVTNYMIAGAEEHARWKALVKASREILESTPSNNGSIVHI